MSQSLETESKTQSLQVEKCESNGVYQGAIFDLAATRFSATEADLERFNSVIPPAQVERIKAEGFKFADLYPFTEYNHETDKFGIVVTQTCDLVKGEEKVPKLSGGKIVESTSLRYPKVPFINIAILEPFERLFISTLERHGDLEDYYLGFEINPGETKFVVSIDKMYSNLFKKEILIAFQNDHKHIFFIEIPEASGSSKLYGADLSKLFPIRVEHHEKIEAQVKFKLKNDFVGALGWKIAELYGRVGLPVYGVESIVKLDEILRKSLNSLFEDDTKVTSDQFTKIKEKIGNRELLIAYLKEITPPPDDKKQ